MTEEKAIELAEEFTKMDFSNPMGWTGYYDTELNKLSQAVQTVLNMLKEKDKEIEYYKKQKDYDMQFRHELLEQIRCLNLNKDEKDEEIEKLKKHNKELLRKLRNRVKEVRKLNKYSLYKKEFKRLNEQIKKKDKMIDLMAEEINNAVLKICP